MVKVPAQSQTLLGDVKVSDMISQDTTIKSDGSVFGTVKFVDSFPEFNSTNLDEQSGNYFPVTLSETGLKMALKKNGVAKEGKTDMDFDKNIIFRVTSKTDKFTIEVDGKEVVTLNFTNATLNTK